MPLQRRVPKFGFRNPNRVEFQPVNLETLQSMADEYKLTEINSESLLEHGLIGKNTKIKVLGRGELTSKLNVTAHAFSASAVKAIEAAGGSATTL